MYCDLNQKHENNSRKRADICRSTFLTAEEISRERAESGWNPYEGEEIEPAEKAIQPLKEASERRAEEVQPLENRVLAEPAQSFRPVFRGSDYEQVWEEQKNVERDLRSLQSMYPEAAKLLLPYVEEMCDKLEYEGSMMFDRFPDQTTLYRMQEAILEQAKDEFSEVPVQEEPDEIFSMQYQGRRHPHGRNWLGDMIRVLLLQEMHHRRCRHRNCRWR